MTTSRENALPVVVAIEKANDASRTDPSLCRRCSRYLVKTYKLKEGPSFDSLVSVTIKKGAEKRAFALPKGASGKVKLGKEAPSDVVEATKPASPSKAKAAKGKENSAPASGATATAAKKKATASKRSATTTGKKASVATATTNGTNGSGKAASKSPAADKKPARAAATKSSAATKSAAATKSSAAADKKPTRAAASAATAKKAPAKKVRLL